MHTYPLLPASNSISNLSRSFWAPSLSTGVHACGAAMLGVSVSVITLVTITLTYYCTVPVCSSLFRLLLLSWHTSALKTNCALGINVLPLLICLLVMMNTAVHHTSLRPWWTLFKCAEQCHINYWLKVVGKSKPRASVIQQNSSQPFMLFYKGGPLVKCDLRCLRCFYIWGSQAVWVKP